MHYTLKDHQGSLTATVHGNTVERLSYDAWGRRRDPDGFGYSNVTHTFDRGYTLHEHYDAFGLINMNGRCYDPLTSSFLSVDAYVQDPTSAQSFNRYAYCMHNPLRYTDPTGWLSGTGRSDAPNLNHSHDETARWHSEDINDVLWGRSVHPCETGNPYRLNSSSQDYMKGNEHETPISLFASKPFSELLSSSFRTVNTYQRVDPFETAILDDIGFLNEMGGEKAYRGQTMMHEVTESYIGGLNALKTGKPAGNASVSRQEFEEAHKAATLQPVLPDIEQILEEFRIRRGK